MAKDPDAGRNATPPRDFLRFDISNFGPVSKGRISLRPLTILMGPGNSGKSYAATMIYAFLSSHAAARHGLDPLARQRPSAGQDGGGAPRPDVKKLLSKDSVTIPAAQANRLASAEFAPIWKDAIEHSFGSPAADLVRFKQKTAKGNCSRDFEEIRILGTRGDGGRVLHPFC